MRVRTRVRVLCVQIFPHYCRRHWAFDFVFFITKAYALILDNLDDAQDLTFAMIQQVCVRMLRRSQARGADRSQERRPATAHRAYKDIQRHKDFTRSKPEDVSAFLVNFLEQRGIKPKKVLKANNLPPATCTTLSLFKLCIIPGRFALPA